MNFLGVDVDGTLVDHRYPELGPEVPHAFAALNTLQKDWKIILVTMRDGPYLSEAVNLCIAHGIKLFGANENITQHTWTSSPKIYCHRYVDDAAVGCPLFQPQGFVRACVDWRSIMRHLGYAEQLRRQTLTFTK